MFGDFMTIFEQASATHKGALIALGSLLLPLTYMLCFKGS